MAASALTSSLVVRLIDQVTAPARAASKSLLGLNRAAGGDFGSRLNDAMARNNAALDRSRGALADTAIGFFALKAAFGAPIKSAIDFETLLEDIGQKADIPVERLAALGQEIKRVAADTNQATTAIANAVDDLLGRGAGEDVALAAAGPIGKAATAYRAATDDLAAASWSAVDNLKVPADRIGTVIDAMAQAGKEGAFELRDMARFFPSLGAAYQGLGQKGTDAVADLAAALQIVRKGTGDSSTAATNLQNVLQKIGSPATLRAFGKMGVNLRKEMQKAEKAGMTPIEAIAEITNNTLKGDLGKLGFLFEDAQVQAGMRSLIQNMEEYKRIRAEAMKASGVVEKDYQRRIETAAGATIRWKASIENLSLAIGTTLLPVMSDLVNRFTPVIDAIGKWTGANPVFTRNVIAATAAVVGFKIAVTGLRYVGLLGRGGALSMMALGYNTVGKAAIFAGRGMKLMAFTPIVAGLNESFAEFGERIAREVGGTFKIVGDRAILAKRNGGVNAAGAALATVQAVWGENLHDYSITPIAGRFSEKSVQTRWYDPKAAEYKTAEAETGTESVSTVYTDRLTASDEQGAQHRATSLAAELDRKSGEGTVTIEGNIGAQPEGSCVVARCRPGINGTYRIEGVTHDYSRSGWVTRLELGQPKGEAGKDKRGKSSSAGDGDDDDFSLTVDGEVG